MSDGKKSLFEGADLDETMFKTRSHPPSKQERDAGESRADKAVLRRAIFGGGKGKRGQSGMGLTDAEMSAATSGRRGKKRK